MLGGILTIDDIVATAGLDTEILAGNAGSSREVLWAHSCEMLDPAQWLGPHELLMTVGLCVPADPAGQVDLIGRLDDAGLAGMMIGDHEPAPALTSEMLAEADRRGFPILLAGPHIPYAVIARHVAAANSSAQIHQVLTLSKLYHLAAYAGDDIDALISSLSNLLGVGIEVVDIQTETSLFSAQLPGKQRLETSTSTRPYQLKGHFPARLRLTEFDGEQLDSFLLVHLIKVLEVASDRILSAAEGRAASSEKLMLALLNGVVTPEARTFLSPHLPSDGYQMAAFQLTAETALMRLAAIHCLPIIVGSDRLNCLALVPIDVMPVFEDLAGPIAQQAGISSTFSDYDDARVAAGEAGRVLIAAENSAGGWTRFEGVAVSVLTRSRREAQQVVEGVLGPLSVMNTRNDVLRETLFAYLRHDRKWKETAEELGIHRQTLSYRLRRIEEETGLNLTKVSDLSAAWIAFQAWTAAQAG